MLPSQKTKTKPQKTTNPQNKKTKTKQNQTTKKQNNQNNNICQSDMFGNNKKQPTPVEKNIVLTSYFLKESQEIGFKMISLFLL